jgi:hypothetical protein
MNMKTADDKEPTVGTSIYRQSWYSVQSVRALIYLCTVESHAA